MLNRQSAIVLLCFSVRHGKIKRFSNRRVKTTEKTMMPAPDKQVTIIIPAYNEEKAIGPVINQLYAECADLFHEVIVVDDGSTDCTAQIVAATPARLIQHKRNRGYGAALKTGVRAAQTEYVLTMDSDGQHRVEYVRKLCNAIGDFDMVVGERTSLVHSPLWRMPGKWLLGVIANYLARRTIPDLNSGLRVMRRSVVSKYLHICPNGFSFSTTITMVMLTRDYMVEYVPIEVEKRIGKSKVSISTGLNTLILIVRIAALFDPLRVFLPASLVSGGIGILWSIRYVLMGRGVSVGSMLAIVTAILLFSLGLICDQISQLRLERFE
jgi:glycosyltransferase involved in cell wall biosynthesis